MKQPSPEKLLLIHYRNIQALSRQQLEAIRQEDTAGISASIEQKQMIIEQIQNMQPEVQDMSFPDDVKAELQHLLTDIAATEAQSRDILLRKQATLQQQLISIQHKKLLQAYEASSFRPAQGRKQDR